LLLTADQLAYKLNLYPSRGNHEDK
jgi:hypothetical protein